MNETTTEKKTPPYLAVSRLEKMFSILSVKTPDVISTLLFTSNGFSKVDALLAINTLKFLGLIDDEKKPTQRMSSLRIKGDKRPGEIKKIAEEAYKPLFDNIEKPHELSKEDLFNAFCANYPGLSDRVYRSAIPVFLKICEYAGLKEAGTVRGWTVKARTDKPRMSEQKDTTRETLRKGKVMEEFGAPDFYMHPVMKGKMTITIPEDIFLRAATEDVLNDAWRTVLKAAHKFAEEHLKDKAPKSEEMGTE